MSISENATGGENEPDVNQSENQENPQVAAADAAIEGTRDAGVSEETGVAGETAANDVNEDTVADTATDVVEVTSDEDDILKVADVAGVTE